MQSASSNGPSALSCIPVLYLLVWTMFDSESATLDLPGSCCCC